MELYSHDFLGWFDTKSFCPWCCATLYEECSKHHGHKGDPRSDIQDLWRRGWEGPSDPSMGEGPERWERLPPTKTRKHKDKTINYA